MKNELLINNKLKKTDEMRFFFFHPVFPLFSSLVDKRILFEEKMFFKVK